MEITADELQALQEGAATIINVGNHAGSREIRNAIRYRPHDLLEPTHLVLPIAPEKLVVLYDERGGGDQTTRIAERLRADGYADVRILQGGFDAWERAGGATQEPSLEQVVPPTRSDEVQQLDRRI
jgi:3-mercaptopyruvate sulfurtransferase SseA